jgi:Zn-dependent M28 family amino/carboxypeptidase
MARPLLASLVLAGCAAAPGSPVVPSGPAPAPPASASSTPAPRRAPPEVGATLSAVDAARAEQDVRTLAAFGTRHTLSDTTSPTRGIGAARAWLKSELAREPALTVSFDAHALAADGSRVPRPIELVNVMAVLPGAMPEARARRYYVVGHYDSRVADVMDATSDAPGANDDASGVTVVLEAARVMAKHRYDATIVFLATAGEEQGLYGAKLHAQAARAAGLDVRAVLNDDIVGDPTGPSGTKHAAAIRLFSEGVPVGADVAELRKLAAESDSPSRQLARYVAEVAAEHALAVRPSLVFRADRFLRGGDHLPFNEVGYPAVRFTTVEETYARQHTPADVPGAVDPAYLADVARLNVAALAHLANAPRPPDAARIVTAELGNDVVLRWSACPEPDLAGYEVVWRPTTSSTWEHARDVGNVTEARLPLSKDDFFYGVRAYDRDGYVSPVSFAKAAQK